VCRIGENCKMQSFVIFSPLRISVRYQMCECETGVVCGARRKEKKSIQNVSRQNIRKASTLWN
jgi:hypothetical protein